MNKPFSVTPTDRKLLKSSKVRAWLKQCEEIIKKQMEENGSAWWEKEK